MTRPLCFVLMPFGQQPTASGFVVNFYVVYRDLIAPAISDADMDPFARPIRRSPATSLLILGSIVCAVASAPSSAFSASSGFTPPRLAANTLAICSPTVRSKLAAALALAVDRVRTSATRANRKSALPLAKA